MINLCFPNFKMFTKLKIPNLTFFRMKRVGIHLKPKAAYRAKQGTNFKSSTDSPLHSKNSVIALRFVHLYNI